MYEGTTAIGISCITVCSIIGLPDELDWPSTISLPRASFPYSPQIPFEEVIIELTDPKGKELIDVSP